ncbi:MAG: tetratricopeptide repeat protein [Acidobacteriota bacterium]
MSLNKSKALRTAEKYVLQGKIPAAIDEYRKVVDADPSDLTTINTLGDLYVRAGKIQDAIKNFSRIADSYREGGFTLKAIAMLKKISKLDPTSIDTSMKLANLYSQQGLLVEARQQYLQVADAFARSNQSHKALEAYQKIADLDPTNTSVRMKLGEIYSREGLMEQSHDAFVTAGNEFLRKGEFEQALTANLKAITANPESRQALTALSTIYSQQGRPEQAINLLCEAFEKSPGDVELLTILGRTYLTAGWMDEAERTFLSLVELDRTRYHYVIEVARKFLQDNQFDRAAEALDGCLDILISKREEDKAIEFMRRILDRSPNNVTALKRLAQIYLRIRDEQNLITALHILADAATAQDKRDDAIVALKELARLEPGDPTHLQRLGEFGINELTDVDASDITGSLKSFGYRPPVEDDSYVFRQIAEAEIMAGHGDVNKAVEMLSAVITQFPDNIQVRLKLKDIFLRAGMMKKAADECLVLARIHQSLGESARASDYRAEAKQLNPLLEDLDEEVVSNSGNLSADTGENSFGFDFGFANSQPLAQDANEAGFAFQESANDIVTDDPIAAFGFQSPTGYESAGGFDLQGSADDWQMEEPPSGSYGFEAASKTPNAKSQDDWSPSSNDKNSGSFRYFDTIVSDKGDVSPVENLLFKATGDLPTDTMPRALRDELEGVDFYITQGYVDIAQDTLERLLSEYGNHPEILSRRKKLVHTASLLGMNISEPAVEEATPAYTNGQSPTGELALDLDDAFGLNAQPESGGFDFAEPVTETSDTEAEPFLIHKESGALDEDLMVKFNTRDLQKDYELMQSLQQPAEPLAVSETPPLEMPTVERAVENDAMADLFDDEMPIAQEAFVSEISAPPVADNVLDSDSPFTGSLWQDAPEAELPLPISPPPVQPVVAPVETPPVAQVQNPAFQLEDLLGLDGEEEEDNELQRMVSDFIEHSGAIAETQDYETHYNLGLAYKDMDLFDDAIEQFQMAFRIAPDGNMREEHIQCCHMLGVCFKQKNMPKVAVMWFKRGLEIPHSKEDEYQALRYEIGLCYEEMGEVDKALDTFMEVYGNNVNYRNVGEKIKKLQMSKS